MATYKENNHFHCKTSNSEIKSRRERQIVTVLRDYDDTLFLNMFIALKTSRSTYNTLWRIMSLYGTKVSEKPSASIFTLLHLGTEAAGFYRTLISTHRNTRRSISQGHNNIPLIVFFRFFLGSVALMDRI